MSKEINSLLDFNCCNSLSNCCLVAMCFKELELEFEGEVTSLGDLFTEERSSNSANIGSSCVLV